MQQAWAQRAAEAQLALRACRLCPRDCGVDRSAGSQGAFCRLDQRAWVYKELLSLGEEPAISPTMLVDLGGCSLRCLFCTEWQHVVQPMGHGAVVLEPDWLAAQMARRKAQGARTISFVGGDPTVSVAGVLVALAACRDPLPVVWNANAMASDQSLRLLHGVVATWVLDAKFGNPQCAASLAGVRGFDVDAELERALAAAEGTRPTPGLPRAILRHLLMPGHLPCCTEPVLRGLAARLQHAPSDILVNLMTGYVPTGPALQRPRRAAELAGWLSAAETAHAVSVAKRLLGPRLRVDGQCCDVAE